MAEVARVNGTVFSDQFVGRELEYFEVTCTAHGEAERDLIIVAMREQGSIEVVGDFGTANTFRLVMSGTNRTAAELEAIVQAKGAAVSNAAVAGATVADFIF